MSETLNTSSQERPEISDADVDKFMSSVDDKYPGGTAVEYDGKILRFDDAVNKFITDDNGNKTGETQKIVILSDAHGEKTVLDAKDFIESQGIRFDDVADVPKQDDPNVLEQIRELTKKPDTEYRKFRHEMVFRPANETSSREESSYDSLLNPEIDTSNNSVEKASIRETVRTRVTPESKKMAEERLEQAYAADSGLAEIFDNYLNAKGISDRKDLTEAMRSDKDLRIAVGGYLIDKIDRLFREMPERVQDDTEKKPSTEGYDHIPRMTSREYATLLALSMLDGTFDDKRVGGDTIEYQEGTNKVILGQHRAAAQKLISLA